MNIMILERFPRLSAAVNSLFKRQKEPKLPGFVRYDKDVIKGESFDIGEYSYCSGPPKVFKHPRRKLKIGKFCSIAPGVTIWLGGNHKMDFVTTYPFPQFVDDWPEVKSSSEDDYYGVSKGDIVIGNDVWIGYGATIMSGVTIGDGSVIGNRAVVTRDVEPYAIVAGNPARLVRKRFDEETIRKLLEIKWWDWPIDKIKKNLGVIYSSNVWKMFELE